MFGFSKNKNPQPSVTPEDKLWVEENIAWFIQLFGLERLKKEPFIIPGKFSMYTDLNDSQQFQDLFMQLCDYWALNPNDIVVKIFDDIRSKQWSTWSPIGLVNEPVGIFYQTYSIEKKEFVIEIAKSNLNNPQLLIFVVGSGLATIKFLKEDILDNSADMEIVKDLATIFLGFGIYIANSSVTEDVNGIERTGALPSPVISYANALICYITKTKAADYVKYLNTNTRELFKKDFDYLEKTGSTTLNESAVKYHEELFELYSRIQEGFATRDFDKTIVAAMALAERENNNITAYNNWGYALLQQKKYKEAIVQFSKTIDIDPYWDTAYNNRGYCKLQLGDIKNAFADLHHSFEMNPDNSFSWRNLGVYYLTIGENENALKYFEQAQMIDPNTEMINFYLGHVNSRLGKIEIAKTYFDKSKELKEHNDSMIG